MDWTFKPIPDEVKIKAERLLDKEFDGLNVHTEEDLNRIKTHAVLRLYCTEDQGVNGLYIPTCVSYAKQNV